LDEHFTMPSYLPSVSFEGVSDNADNEASEALASTEDDDDEEAEDEQWDAPTFVENDEDDASDDDGIENMFESLRYVAQNEALTPKWKDVDNPSQHLRVHMNYAREKAFQMCKEEMAFVKERVEIRLVGRSSTSFKNIMDIFFGPTSYLWMALNNNVIRENMRTHGGDAPPIQMTHGDFMKNVATFFFAASYHEVSASIETSRNAQTYIQIEPI
jgi:hypothetical protein